MSVPAGPRLSFDALHRFMGPSESINEIGGTCDNRMTHLARIAGINRRNLQTWRHLGVPLKRADDIAVALGAHPCEIWPEWFDLP